MHPTRLIQLSHTRVDDGIAGHPDLPGGQILSIGQPGKVVEFGLKSFGCQMRSVLQQMVGKFPPHQFLSPCFTRTGIETAVGLIRCVPELIGTDFTEP